MAVSLPGQFDAQHVFRASERLRANQEEAQVYLGLRRDVTTADVNAFYDDMRKRGQVLVDKALPDLTDLALSLQQQQIAHIEKKFASNNDSFRKDYLKGDIEHRQRYRYKKALEQAEHWFGDFSREQQAQIRAASDARPWNNELWMAERLQRQRELILLQK